MVALLIVTVLGGGCGGDDASSDGSSDTPSADKRPTKAEFIERADAICTKYRKRTDKLGEDGDSPSSAKEQAKVVRQLADEADSTLKEFEDLELPPGDNAPIEQYKELAREQIELVRRAGEALDDGKVQRATTLINSGDETAGRLRGIAQGYGFKVCGSKRS